MAVVPHSQGQELCNAQIANTYDGTRRTYRIVVKVIDILGNDTTKLLNVDCLRIAPLNLAIFRINGFSGFYGR